MAKYPVQMAFSMCLQIVSDTLYGNYRTILHEMENSSNFSGYEEQRGNLDVYIWFPKTCKRRAVLVS